MKTSQIFLHKPTRTVFLTLLSVLGILLFAAADSHAADQGYPTPKEKPRLEEGAWAHTGRPTQAKEKKWEIASEIFWFFYEEPGISVEWDGIMYGARFAYTDHYGPHALVGRLEGSIAAGSVDYDGSLSDGTPFKDEGDDWIAEVRWLLGRDWQAGGTIFRPLVGLGYRYWFDDLESSSAYRRRIQYLYSPIGFETISAPGGEWRFGFRGEFDLFWRGWVKSHLSDVTASFNDPENTQDDGFGARGSFYFTRISEGKTTISIEPFIRYWDIDDSDTAPVTFAGTLVGGGYEPANKTIESGLRISFLF